MGSLADHQAYSAWLEKERETDELGFGDEVPSLDREPTGYEPDPDDPDVIERREEEERILEEKEEDRLQKEKEKNELPELEENLEGMKLNLDFLEYDRQEIERKIENLKHDIEMQEFEIERRK